MEEKRRALMFETVNVQKDVPFKIGDVVFDYSLCSTDDPHGAEAVVIGLPSKKALAELCRMPACERVFSLLKNFLGDQMMTALADGIATGLMLAYNKRAFG